MHPFTKVGQTLRSLFSPNVEKALTFLDDRPLPETSNVVESGNRRHRQVQKSAYRVRTLATLTGRMALDLFHDASALYRGQIIQWLHQAGAGPVSYATR